VARIVVSVGVALATLAAGSLRAAEESWQLISEKNGIILEKRVVPESRFQEYRARAHTTVSPPAAVMRIWSNICEEHSPTVKRRTVLRRAEDELVVHDQIHAPVVSDRDVVIRIRKLADTRTGGFEIQFEATTELGPPPAAGYVRLPVVRGGWRIEPSRDGGTNLAYRCYSEPGGAIPAFLVRGVQQGQVLEEFERVLQRVGR